MIITLDSPKFILNNFFMLDTKRNIIMDGNFTKIIYSNHWFTMNGLYVLFPIEILSIDINTNKRILKFNPYLPSNTTSIQEFAKMEYKILEYYKQTKHSDRKISNLLAKQMYSGYMKIFKEFNKMYASTDNSNSSQYVIKISGIWESRDEIGLTYKLFEANENYM
jgi:hypothetical protein